MDGEQVEDVLKALNEYPVSDFLTSLLENPPSHGLMLQKQFLDDLPTLLKTLINHPDTRDHMRDITFDLFTTTLKTEVAMMASKTSGWHFSAENALSEQIDAFSVNGMAETLTKCTPYLWAILGTLLSGDSQVKQKRV